MATTAESETPRARRRERRRAKIYDCALSMFAERGFDAVTVEDIAEAADIAKGTFFNYFPSKEHLLVAYRRDLFDFIHAYGETLAGDSARTLFKQYFRKLAGRIRREGAKYGMLTKEVVARPHLIALEPIRQQRYRGHFVRFLEAGQSAGEVPKGADLERLAEIIRDIWTSTLMTWVLEKRGTSLEREMSAKLDLFFDLLGAAAREI